jgi:tRNA threonylcarbamoyladenosine modification (KEOPS) complex  Pcc1 subunit
LRGRMPEKSSPRVRCTLTLEFESKDDAEKVHRSVELDNLGYLESAVKENLIIADMEADSLKSLLHTLEDFLACTSVASRIVSKKD